jgi:hypothetical protein
MTPKRYQQLCALFDQAQQQPAAERGAFVRRVAADDPALGFELEQLLAHGDRARAEPLFADPCPANARALQPAGQGATND